ncbi:branched-chain amino acid transaminase [bacterium]|nr:branched-chain amino acid transaminase [bacterium]
MTEFYFLNGEYVPAAEAVLPVRTHAFLYGTSVFEGIRAYYNQKQDKMYAFRMKEHFERMHNSCKIMFMDPKYSIEEYCNITKDLLIKNNYRTDAYIRPTVFKAAQKVGPSLLDNPDGVLIFTTALGSYFTKDEGLSVCVSSWDRLEDNTIPPRAKISGAYANTALIVTEAKLAGFDDAIVLSNDGHVAEGSAMNFFLVKGDTLITSKETSNILVGVTRNTVIELAQELGLKVVERDIDRTELYVADEAFYCGTGAQVMPVTKIDNRPVGTGSTGKNTEKIQKLYFDLVRGELDIHREWLTEIY